MMFVKALKKRGKAWGLKELLRFYMFGMIVMAITVCGLYAAPAITFAIAGAVASFAGIMLVAWMLVTCLEEYEKLA